MNTTPHGGPVHSGTNSNNLGSIQPCCNYCMKTIHSNFHCCLQPGSNLELGHCGKNENAQYSKQQQMGFEPRNSRLRVLHSTAELPCTCLLFATCAARCFSRLEQLLDCLVAEGGEIRGRLLAQGSYLCRRNQREHVLDACHALRPELVPEHFIRRLDRLQCMYVTLVVTQY